MSNIHRFLSRRDRRPKVTDPLSDAIATHESLLTILTALPSTTATRSLPTTAPDSSPTFANPTTTPPSTTVFNQLAFWRNRDSSNSTASSSQVEKRPGHTRSDSAITVRTLAYLPFSFSLARAGSNRQSRKRPHSFPFTAHTSTASSTDWEILPASQNGADASFFKSNAPDEGTFAGFFLPDEEAKKKKFDKDEEKQIKTILARLQSAGITMFNEANIDYALRSKATNGNMEEAFRLLLLFEDTYEGLVRSYNPNTKLLGAENRSGVTCYLDALLFAMFARLDSFEAMLYNAFEDPPRKKLAGLMRLWVNMLRDGKLITTDIVRPSNKYTLVPVCG